MKLEPLDNLLKSYFNNFLNYIKPKNKKYKYIIYLIHILHFLGCLIFFILGIFMPSKLQIYLFYIYLFILISWIIFRNCLITMITNYLGNTDIKYFIPVNHKIMYILCIFNIIISLLFYLFPRITPYYFLTFLNKNF